MKCSLSIVIVLFLMTIKNGWASQDIVVQGLFSGKAVILIDGQRRIISIGESSPEGVKLVNVDASQATLEVDGQQKNYILGSPVSLNFSRAESIQEKIFADDSGMFMTVGSINGRSVRFLVDTGATSIAMNTTQARRLGVRYKIDSQAATASTASGFVNAYRARLKSVTLGKT